jgi:hypothetical protein
MPASPSVLTGAKVPFPVGPRDPRYGPGMSDPTVRQLKKAAEELATALDYCADYLAKQDGRGDLAGRARAASDGLEGFTLPGKESDPAPADAVARVAEAVRVGREVLDTSDAGRKLPRVSGYISGAESLLA